MRSVGVCDGGGGGGGGVHMQRLVFRVCACVCVCVVGKPRGGGKREPPSVCVCVVANEPSAVSRGSSGGSASDSQ